MPLPTAPTKRAALLSAQEYDVPARPKTKSSLSKTRPAEVPAVSEPELVVSLPPPIELQQEATPLEQAVTKPKTSNRRPRVRVASTVTETAKATPKPHDGPLKLFVLDTNVLLHDPSCLFRFEEHDVFLPMIVLEELDAHKKGMTEVARNGRQTSRSLDALAEHQGSDISTGLLLSSTGHREARGRLFFQTQLLNYDLPASLPQGKADNQILGVVEALRKQHAPRDVVLVSKDINMRVKA